MALDPIQIDEVPVPLLEVRDGVIMRASAQATSLLVPTSDPPGATDRPPLAIGRPGSATAQNRCTIGPTRASPTHSITSSQKMPT